MSESTGKNIRLGLMVMAGLALLIATLYVIGRNENLFGSHFSLRARFRNVNGLMKGNNIRFAGIQAGTVRDIRVLNDTTIEVTLLIDEGLHPYIHRNALAAIGTEGLIGNKVVNILPVTRQAPTVRDGDLLNVQQAVNTDEMLLTLDRTNRNMAEITEGLKATIARVNGSAALWSLLNDRRLDADLRASLAHIRGASGQAEQMTRGLRALVDDVRSGKGSVGRLLTDTALAGQLSAALDRIRDAGEKLGSAGRRFDKLAASATSIVKDSALQTKLQETMENIRQGTRSFSEDMEALKHNFLFRGYFRRLEKEAKRAQGSSPSSTPQLRKPLE